MAIAIVKFSIPTGRPNVADIRAMMMSFLQTDRPLGLWQLHSERPVCRIMVHK